VSEELICITCPIGCHLSVDRLDDGNLSVTGNRCARGVKYATEELLAPRRVVSATVALAGSAAEKTARLRGLGTVSRLPVRTSAGFPRNGVPELLKAIYALDVGLPVRRGDVLIADYQGSGVDVIATRSLGL
jgi:CxxC motif-containing protein